MSRIRTVKPEFFTSEQVAECSTNARLMFVGMWCFCDDQGVHPASTRRLKMEVFPGDPFTDEQVGGWIAELIAVGLIAEFEADGNPYWHVTGWRHQRIDRPSNKFPPPPTSVSSPNKSRNHRQPIDDQSDGARRTFDEGSSSPSPRRGGYLVTDKEPTVEDKKGAAAEAPPAAEKPKKPLLMISTPPEINTPEFNEAWTSYLDYRKQRKLAALLPKSVEKQFAQLVSWEKAHGLPAVIAAIHKTIANGWQGIFEPRDDRRPGKPNTGDPAFYDGLRAFAESHSDRQETT